MSCLQQVLKDFFTFTIAKYAKNRNYVPPSNGKTVLVWPSKDKDAFLTETCLRNSSTSSLLKQKNLKFINFLK